jgi:hypothetical protein
MSAVRTLTLLCLLLAPLRADTLKVPQQFEHIQDAVNVAAPGDVVLVSKGLYQENVVVDTSGISLRGKAGATVDGNYVGSCITVSGNDVEVTGFVLVCGGIGQLLLSDGPPPAGGLDVTGDDAQVSKLVVRSCEAWGIRIKTGRVESCTVDGCNGYGIWAATGDSLGNEPTVIEKCKVYRCVNGISALDGPFRIEKNQVEQCTLSGIHLLIETLLVDAPPIVHPSLVSGNTCTGSFQYAMFIESGAGTTTVEKNTASRSGFGLAIGGFGLQVLSNTVEDNALFGLFVSASGTHVAKNKVRGNGGLGLFIGFGGIITDGSPTNGSNHVEDNLVQDNSGDGIEVFSGNNNVHDNVSKGNLGDGLQLLTDAVGNTVEGNLILANGHDGLDNWGTDTLITDNTCKGNGGADLAGIGSGGGTNSSSSGNVTGDGSGLLTPQEKEMASESI